MKITPNKKNYKLTLSGKIVVSLAVLIVISITTLLYARGSNTAIRNEINRVKYDTERIRESIDNLNGEIRAIHEHLSLQKLGTLDSIEVYTSHTDVLVTNYWPGDGSSGTTTASGLSIEDFEVNEEGMYTFENQVVVATANTDRFLNNLNQDYSTNSLFDELAFTFNGKTYQGIVLDVCGACYGVANESKQRYDIFTVENVIGKVEAILHE